MGNVINLTAALWRRVAALEVEVAEYRQAADEAPRGGCAVIDLTTALRRRTAAPDVEAGEHQQTVNQAQAPRNKAAVIDLTAALWRRAAALELEVDECRRVVSQVPPRSWRHKVYIAELIEAERRLSIAEGMRRDERA